MKRNLVYFAVVLLVAILLMFLYTRNEESTSKLEDEKEAPTTESFIELTYPTKDELTIHADLYENTSKDAPVILLFHQARYSRGAYREIAPKLNELGFICMAVDQRSGKEVNGVPNETFLQAEEKGLGVKYPDAYPDLESTLLYASEKYPNEKFIVWGSSYSAALVFILTQKHPDLIKAIVAFSPGEYFEFEGRSIPEYAQGIDCPVFITSAGDETAYWKNIYDKLNSKDKISYLPEVQGKHGSSALYDSTEGHEGYWEALVSFLKNQK